MNDLAAGNCFRKPLKANEQGKNMNQGMVVAPQPEAVEAGVLILREGGNAVDAGIACGLLPPKQLKPTAGRILLQDENLFEKSELELREMRGAKMSMIFQEPMTALNPVVTVGDQIEEVLRIHRPSNPKERARLCNEVMAAVNLPEPEKLRKKLWGDSFYDAKAKKWKSEATSEEGKDLKRAFV